MKSNHSISVNKRDNNYALWIRWRFLFDWILDNCFVNFDAWFLNTEQFYKVLQPY